MKRLPLLLLLCFLLSPLTALAQESGKSLLILPFEMRGTYLPIDSAELSTLLEENLKKVSPDVTVKIHDEKVYMIGAQEAARIGETAGVDYVLYGDARFRKDVKGAHLTGMSTEGYPGGSGINQGYDSRYMVTIAAVGHGRLVDVKTGELIADQPELLLESEYTGAAKGGSRMEKLEKKLADICVHQFTKHLIEKLKEEAEGRR